MSLITSFTDSGTDVNNPVVLTLPAAVGITHVLSYLDASFTSGGVGDVFVEINGFEVFRAPVGNGVKVTWNGLYGNPNESLVVTLDAGGPFITGVLRISGVEN